MRLIDADALQREYMQFHDGKRIVLVDVAPTIEPEWIPCSERLPEFDKKVLAYVKNKDPEGRFNQEGIYTAELKDKIPKHDPKGTKNIWGIPGYDSEWAVRAWSYFTEPDVVAWMPLPKPYKED